MAEEIGFENGRNSNFEGLVTLTLTLDPVIRHTVVHHSSTSTYVTNFIEIEETFCGRTDGRTDGRTFSPSNIIRSTFGSRPNKNTLHSLLLLPSFNLSLNSALYHIKVLCYFISIKSWKCYNCKYLESGNLILHSSTILFNCSKYLKLWDKKYYNARCSFVICIFVYNKKTHWREIAICVQLEWLQDQGCNSDDWFHDTELQRCLQVSHCKTSSLTQKYPVTLWTSCP